MKTIKYILLVVALFAALVFGWLGYMAYTTDIKLVGVMDIPAAKFLGIKKASVPMKDYKKVMTEAFSELKRVTEGAEVDFGSAFSLYQKSTGKDYDLTMGIEFPSDIKVEITPDEIVYSDIRPEVDQAMVFELKGPYDKLFYSWMYAMYKASTSEEYKVNKDLPSMEIYKKYDENGNNKEFETLIIIPVTKK